MSGIYIHIPWCKQVCYYCDFHFRVSMRDKQKMLETMCREIDLRKNYLGESEIKTVYFGGGTPSVLTVNELEYLLNKIKDNFRLDKNYVEITAEVNPDDLDYNYLSGLKKIGINRLSIGIQSFDDNILKWMNRRHNAETAEKSIIMATEAGFKNISADLIYGIPGMDNELWKKQVKKMFSLPVTHFSAYHLTIEPATPFGVFMKRGNFAPAGNDIAAENFLTLMDMLPEQGFLWYEVANFCLPGYESKHNSSYWLREKYIGIGPSAHSFDLTSRQWNIAINREYIEKVNNGGVFYERETLSVTDSYHDYILTSIRTYKGVNYEYIRNNLGTEYENKARKFIIPYISSGHAENFENGFRLTVKGLLLADKITSELFC